MKVIFITREGYRLAGARIRCYNFARELDRHGVKTEVLSFADSLGAKDGIEEARMGLVQKIGYNLKAFHRLKKEKNTFFYLQRFNYHALAPYLVSFGNNNRIILDLDDWEMKEEPRYYFGFYHSSKAHFLTRLIARKSVVCIAASRFLEDFLKTLNARVYYIPTGVDTDFFKPSRQDLGEKEFIFSWVGTLHRKEYIENLRFALECFGVLRKKYEYIYFDVVGDGRYGGDLRCMVDEYHDGHIRIKGWLVPESIPGYLEGVHAGLLPIVQDNKFNRSKSPTKLFEYMAMAKPTVSSNIGEARYIIRDADNGFLADRKEEFIKKMELLINDAVLRQRMGSSACRDAEGKYSLAVLGKSLSRILSGLDF